MNNPPNNNPQIVHYSSPQLPRSQPQQGNQYNFGNQQNQNKQQNRPISPNYSNQSQPHLRSHNPHQQFSNNQRPVSPPSVAAQYSNVQSNFNFQQQQSTRINNPLHPQENFNNAQQQVHSQHQQFINPPQSSGGFNSFENNMNNQNYSAPQHSGMGNQFLSGDQQFNAAAFLNDPTTQIGMKIGTQALASGQEIVNKNLGKYMSMTHIKYYFNVSNGYVLSKILLLVFPFRHKSWTRLVNRSEQNGEMEGYKVPREDINAPDIYIPVMSFVTYVLLVAVKLGSAKK
ncbi:hypothetical protein HDU92_006146 [Lobulomyces angularis]|nr:hypothetical protein HDU92_006146 [Lobulomyces angularis]